MGEAEKKREVRAPRKHKGSSRDARRAERVKKMESQKKSIIEENKKRRVQGKKEKHVPGSFKPSIWEKLAEEELYRMLRHMGDPTIKIDKFQRNRVVMTLAIIIIFVILGKYMHYGMYFAGLPIGFLFYKSRYRNVANYYRVWKFERHLNFSKFTRLIIPYLKASGSTALYTTFSKILMRTEKQEDKDSLYQLMGEMGDDPTNIQPFEDFAERSSGSDMSSLFMQTIFDFQQSTSDPQVIEELGELASKDMMSSIDDIIAMKLRRFAMFPTKVVMCSFILVVGLAGGIVMDNFKDLNFNGASIQKEAKKSTDTKEADAMAKDADAKATDAGTPEEQMMQQDADKAKKAVPKKATVKKDTMEKWQTDIQSLAKGSGSKRDKFYELTATTNTYTFPESDVETFKNDLYESFVDNSYLSQAKDEAALTRIFKAQVVYEAYDAKKKENDPMRQAAFDYWANAKFVYIGDKKPTDKLITKNAGSIKKNLETWRIEQGFSGTN